MIEEGSTIEHFERESYLVYGFSNESELFTLFVYRVLTKDKIEIEEVVNIFSGNVISRNLSGITEEEYSDLIGGLQRTICFASFDSCYANTNRSMEDPESQVLCEWLPCKTINYAVCTIMAGSGYIQNLSNFIGEDNCDVIYN